MDREKCLKCFAPNSFKETKFRSIFHRSMKVWNPFPPQMLAVETRGSRRGDKIEPPVLIEWTHYIIVPSKRALLSSGSCFLRCRNVADAFWARRDPRDRSKKCLNRPHWIDPDSARVESRNFKSNRIFFFALSFSLFLLCALAFYFLLCFTSVYYSISPPASLFLLFYYLLFSLFIFTFNSFINYFLIPSLFIKMYKKCEK